MIVMRNWTWKGENKKNLVMGFAFDSVCEWKSMQGIPVNYKLLTKHNLKFDVERATPCSRHVIMRVLCVLSLRLQMLWYFYPSIFEYVLFFRLCVIFRRDRAMTVKCCCCERYYSPSARRWGPREFFFFSLACNSRCSRVPWVRAVF